ncbi:DUF177 domain-containing protein [Lampropedia puyangensis]|uniref:Large ribosomal RNA subunit accumulation protein YceD n=1 Tax=Lampropedia puyangensis TaxID=1330072 RepID=A0A4S8F977_9BURK|nr:DUF177 domain-containing protein [Lampropedia puyangensis]THU03769.1 DUF177 domain-containing protein [Lampropedia puyangensis]
MEKTPQLTRLDVVAFAKAQGVVEQTMGMEAFPRLSHEAALGADVSCVQVHWRAAALMRANPAGESVPWLLCEAQTVLPMQCQRCLQPVDTALQTSQWFRFVTTEQEADREDEESLEDVLSLEEPVNLLRLVEDDLLMALPSVAMHEDCQPPVLLQAKKTGFDVSSSGRPNPFAKLAELAVKPVGKGRGELAD